MADLEMNYQDIAKKKRDLYRKWWAFSLNVNIKAGNWRFDNLRAGINQLDESKTGIDQEMKKTILNTIRNNLIGEDQDLAEKTMALLKQDPVLAQKLSNVSNAPEMKKVL